MKGKRVVTHTFRRYREVLRQKSPALLTGLLAAVMGATLIGATPLQAQDPDLSWPPAYGGPGQIGFIIEDAWLFSSDIRVPTPGDQPMCASLDDPKCVDLAAEHGWWVMRVAPPCAEALAWEECVEGIRIRRDGQVRDLTLMGTAPGRTFAADEARGLPTGSTMSLFEDPSDPSVRYAVQLSGQMSVRTPSRDRPFTLNTFAAQVIPYRTAPGGLQPGTQCLFTAGGECSYRVPFPDGASYSLSLRLTNNVTGWLGGRLADPSIDVTPLNGRLNRLTVDAEPVDVPLVAIAIPDGQATAEILDHWRANYTCAGNLPCTSGVMSGESSGPHGFDHLRLFTDFLGDTATRVIPTWSISSLPQTSAQSCLADRSRLVGLVTTNATVYGAAPPAFTGGSLTYQVAALHRVPGGDVLSGSYDLVLRSDAARCLYGFTKAPIRAEISVTSDNGVEQVATTSVSEHDGWIRLAARNFTFSAPTIGVKLSQDEPTRVRLICLKVNAKVKGPKKLTVVGTTADPPKCPRGYRRK